MAPLSRRRLLMLLGGGLAGAAVLRPVMAAVDSARLARGTASGTALGSAVSLVVLHHDSKSAQEAADAALAELQRVDKLLSLYREDSEVGRLNRAGELSTPHHDLLDVLRQAQDISARSGGAFDVTVQPLWQLFSAAKTEGRLPDAAAIAAARGKVDYRKLRVSENGISFAESGMALTLNGIAQGFAADRAAEVLRCRGVEHALINAGEIAALGSNNGKAWAAGIQHPRRDDAYLTLARLQGRCLATSGDYATTFTSDRLHHHIFDPATGDSPLELSSVSVAAPTATLADALATTVVVLGTERGMKLLEQYKGVDALLVRKDGKQFVTANFPRVEA